MTWKKGQKPHNARTVHTKFIFTPKFDENGNTVRHKARLVAKGFMQDTVEQTLAPVIDFDTIRTCLAVAVQKGYHLQQMDIRTAFLHKGIKNKVYVSPLDGINLSKVIPGEFLELQKGLYGLKEAPRLWYDKFSSVMLHLKFASLKSDSCVYRRGNIWIILYVDDIILMGPTMNDIKKSQSDLSQYFDGKKY